MGSCFSSQFAGNTQRKKEDIIEETGTKNRESKEMIQQRGKETYRITELLFTYPTDCPVPSVDSQELSHKWLHLSPRSTDRTDGSGYTRISSVSLNELR